MTDNDTVTNGWPDRVDWRDDLPDQPLVAAQVLAAAECLRCHDAETALARLRASGIPPWRHAVHAVALLSSTLAGRTEEGTERLRLIKDDVLDWGDDDSHRDVRLTVLTAVEHWAAKDCDALDALVRFTPFGPRQWTWQACWLIAGVSSGPDGEAWLRRVGDALREFTDRQPPS